MFESEIEKEILKTQHLERKISLEDIVLDFKDIKCKTYASKKEKYITSLIHSRITLFRIFKSIVYCLIDLIPILLLNFFCPEFLIEMFPISIPFIILLICSLNIVIESLFIDVETYILCYFLDFYNRYHKIKTIIPKLSLNSLEEIYYILKNEYPKYPAEIYQHLVIKSGTFDREKSYLIEVLSNLLEKKFHDDEKYLQQQIATDTDSSKTLPFLHLLLVSILSILLFIGYHSNITSFPNLTLLVVIYFILILVGLIRTTPKKENSFY